MLTEKETSVENLSIVYKMLMFIFIVMDIFLIGGIFGFIDIHKPLNESFYVIDLRWLLIYIICLILIFVNQVIILVLIHSQKIILENTNKLIKG